VPGVAGEDFDGLNAGIEALPRGNGGSDLLHGLAAQSLRIAVSPESQRVKVWNSDGRSGHVAHS
jgi:hypothetical protein